VNILHLPKWYPDAQNPQLGIFVKKHALAASRFHKITLVYATQGSKKELRIQQVNHNFTEIISSYKHTAFPAAKPLNYLRNYAAWNDGIKYAQKHFGPFDGIHAHVMLRPALMAFHFGKKQNIPYVISEHWTGYTSGAAQSKLFPWKSLATKTARNACQIMPVSIYLRESMQKFGLKGNYTVIPNVIENPPELSDTPVIQTKGTNIVVVCDLVDRLKNISGVLQAFNAVAARNSDVYLHIGGDGPDREKLKKMAAGFNLLNEKVFFYGMLTNPEAHRLISQSSFVVINSHIETFSVVTGEALLHGKPVIATRSGGPEGIVNPDEGLIIPPGDVSALQEAMTIMISTFEKYDPEKLQQSIRERYSTEVIGKQIDAVYRNCFRPKSPSLP
jgi:glycosyltransferase involved in cell wall biosynthesis